MTFDYKKTLEHDGNSCKTREKRAKKFPKSIPFEKNFPVSKNIHIL